MTEFNLARLVRQVYDESDTPDPTLLAKEVNRRIRKADRDAALEQCLRQFVMYQLSRIRMARCAPPEPQGTVSVPNSGRSAKVAAIREHWRRALREWVPVAPKQWKFFGDCTADDLAYVAGLREEHARRTWASAAHIRRIQALLAEHDVATVGELPETVLREQLGGSAAA